jgi:hypothetical protein
MPGRSGRCRIQVEPDHTGSSKVHATCQADDIITRRYRLRITGIECPGELIAFGVHKQVKSKLILYGRFQPILHPPKPLYKPTFQPVYPPETAITASNPQLYYLKDEEIDLATFLKNAHTTPSKATVGGESGVRWKSHWLAVEGVQPLVKENPITLLSEHRQRQFGQLLGD